MSTYRSMEDSFGGMQLNSDDEDEVRSSAGRSPQFHGLRVLAFVTNSAVCKMALQLARSFLQGKCTEITLAHCAPNMYSYEGMQGVLGALAEGLSGFRVNCELFEKREDQTLIEALQEYAMLQNPDLLILASTTLCNDARMEEAAAKAAKRTSHSGSGGLSVHASKPSRQAFAMKLCQAIRSVPVLVVKANSRGGFFSYQGTTNVPLKFMIDLQPTSRHLLAWLMNLMEAGKDSLYLAVSKAYDATGVTTQVAVRMITAFSVQARRVGRLGVRMVMAFPAQARHIKRLRSALVNKFKSERRLFKDAGDKALPSAVTEDEIDVLMVQAPRTKDLSPYLINLLCSAPTSILIWPAEPDSSALGQKPPPSDSGEDGLRPMSAMSGIRSVSRTTSIGHDSNVSSSRPASRSSPYSASGYNYTYSHQAAPTMDANTKAAMDAMAARLERRKIAEDKVASMAANQQRSRPGALG